MYMRILAATYIFYCEIASLITCYYDVKKISTKGRNEVIVPTIRQYLQQMKQEADKRNIYLTTVPKQPSGKTESSVTAVATANLARQSAFSI